MLRRHVGRVAPLVLVLTLVPATADAQEGSARVLLLAPGQTSPGSPTGDTTTDTETGATGASPSASPSPAGAAGRFGGPGIVVLGFLIGGFLLLRTRLLRRRP